MAVEELSNIYTLWNDALGLIYWIEPGLVVPHFKVFFSLNVLSLMQNFFSMFFFPLQLKFMSDNLFFF
jgi:hypothetical protein